MVDHRLTAVVDGVEIDGWHAASIESDILTPADAFSLTHAYDSDVYQQLRLDAEITILIDDVPVLNGFIEERSGDSAYFTVTGKDRIGRMIAESAPIGLMFGGQDLATVAAELAGPWFERITFSNARNRDVMRGRGRKARAAEPPLLDQRTDARKVAAGANRWTALDELLDRAGYLAWSSGDGAELIIAKPNYQQEVQFVFFETRDTSNCAGIQYRESNASRYSVIITAGVGRGNDINYAIDSAQRVGIARDNPDAFDGLGTHFLHPKRLVVPVETISTDECQRLADKERAEREAVAFEVEITAWSWAQSVPPAPAPTLYTHDVVVSAFAEHTPVDDAYYVTARTFVLSREQELTRLRCVPLGVIL